MFTVNTDWNEKYRPSTIDECVLPDKLKDVFKGIVRTKDVPNILLTGRPGVGKTTVARAMCNELGCDMMFLNASKDSGIDVLRNKIEVFASTVSLSGGGQKVVIWDEGDNLTYASQTAARAFFEEYSKNCRFIITSNYKQKILPPLLSRLTVVEFIFPRAQKVDLAVKMCQRIFDILNKENVEYNKKVVGQLVAKLYPDFRKCISELQKYHKTCGKIDTGILADIEVVNVKTLMNALKNKNFSDMRSWVVENLDSDTDSVIRMIFDSLETYMEKSSIPQAILILSNYQYKASFVSDHEINMTAMLLELMADCLYL